MNTTAAMTPTETTTFEYKSTGWIDQLVKVNDDVLTYDANGNVLTYGDKVYTWERGRIFKSITEGENTYSYTYDEDGIRTSKTVNGVTTRYNTEGGTVLSQSNGVDHLIFEYDASGAPTGFHYNGAHFFYLTNQLGDVIGITDTSGNPIALYHYDECGNLLAIVTATEGNTQQMNVAMANPLRYRGYYYDTETGYYYLQSRYYDPSICRFINADVPEFLGFGQSLANWNLFSYCVNDPVNNVDETGHAAINVIFAAVGAVVGWTFGDFVAKRLGYYSGAKYWVIRAGVLVGGGVLGWFAGSLLAKIVAIYLKNNPTVIFKIINRLGAASFYVAMKILGINPFTLSMDSSKFIAILRLFNNKAITIGYDWAVQLYNKARDLGFKITLDSPHNEYTWHIHINGINGKLSNLHIQIVKKAWEYLSKLLK